MNSPKHALIIKIGAIGDAIMALPLARELKLKGYTLTWVAGSEIVPVLELIPEIDQIITVKQASLFGNWLAAGLELMKTWMRLLKIRPEQIYILHGDFRYSFLVPPWLARKSLSYVRPKTRRHHTFEYARLAHPEKEDHQLQFEPYCLPATSTPRLLKTVCLFPGGAKNALRDDPLRRWPLESYSELTKLLLNAGYEVTISGGPSDLWIEGAFTALKSRVRWSVGTMKLPETIRYLQSQALAVTHDTGPIHLASIADCPTVSIFGPTLGATVAPLRYQNLALELEPKLPCQPCYDGKDYGVCTNNLCMKSISAEAVFSRISAYFQTI